MRTRALLLFSLALVACTSDDSVASAPDASGPNEAGPNGDANVGPNDASTNDVDAAPIDAGVSAYAAAVLADSPVAYWRFGESSGTKAKNWAATGSAYDLTLSAGFPAADVGRPGLIASDQADKAIFLSGTTNASVPLGTSTEKLKAGTTFTIEAWVRMTSAAAGASNTIMGTKSPTATDGFWFTIAGNGKFGIGCPSIGFFSGTTLIVPFDDLPHHVAVAWEGAGSSATFYLDGVTEVVTGQPNVNIKYSTPTVTVGSWPPNGINFIGVLDEVAFYDSALSVNRLDAHRAAVQ